MSGKAIPSVRPDMIDLAVRIRSAVRMHPSLFEQVPTQPIFVDGDGNEYRFANNEMVRADLAVVKRMRQSGLSVHEIAAVDMRIRHMAAIIYRSELSGFVEGQGEMVSVSEFLLQAIAIAFLAMKSAGLSCARSSQRRAV